MVLLSFEQKDVFVSTTQTQNLGRLLSSVCREAQNVIRDLVTKTENSADALSTSSLVANTVRQELWERVRVLRELYLKCIVLVTLNGDSANISDLVQIGAAMWDVRETVRRRAQEFYEIQWPPMGSYPPPQPPWALDIANNVLVSSDPRTLPKYAQLAVEQAGCNTFVDAIKNIRLPLKTRRTVGQRLTSIIRAEYALALSKTEELRLRTLKFVEFRLDMGRVHLESPGEFHVTFFTDFRRYQFERYRVFVGGSTIVAPELEIMGSNTLQSACNVVVETFEALKKRSLYEVNGWKALINASKETRQKAKDLKMLARWLLTANALGDQTKVSKKSLIRILEEDLYQKILEAGSTKEGPAIETLESIHKDDDDALFEATPPPSPVDAEPVPESEEKWSLNCAEDLGDLTGSLYRALWEMEKKCLEKMITEREAYRSIEGNEFTFEFYRFVVLLAARISRLGSLLILRDQARNMIKCTAAPGGVIYVREWKLPSKFVAELKDEERMNEDKAGSVKSGHISWRDLFAKYFVRPPDTALSLADEYPATLGVIPFANLFPISALPIHTDVVDIDFLPGLPLSILTKLLGTSHPEHICRLTFGLDQAQAELFVLLQPLDRVIKAYRKLHGGYDINDDVIPEKVDEIEDSKDSDGETLCAAAIDQVVCALRKLPELGHFYSDDLSSRASSSLIRGFGGRFLNLTEWIAQAYEILNCLVLTTISYGVNLRPHWQALKLSDGIEFLFKSRRCVKIYVNLLTGYIDIHPIVVKLAGAGPFESTQSLGVDLVIANTDVLVASLNDGDVAKFLGILESIESSIEAQSQKLAGNCGAVCEEIVLCDDDVLQQSQSIEPPTKRTKIV